MKMPTQLSAKKVWKTGECSECRAWIGVPVLTPEEKQREKTRAEFGNKIDPRHQQASGMCSFCAYMHGQGSLDLPDAVKLVIQDLLERNVEVAVPFRLIADYDLVIKPSSTGVWQTVKVVVAESGEDIFVLGPMAGEAEDAPAGGRKC
jgi:hypothetical protein